MYRNTVEESAEVKYINLLINLCLAYIVKISRVDPKIKNLSFSVYDYCYILPNSKYISLLKQTNLSV